MKFLAEQREAEQDVRGKPKVGRGQAGDNHSVEGVRLVLDEEFKLEELSLNAKKPANLGSHDRSSHDLSLFSKIPRRHLPLYPPPLSINPPPLDLMLPL